MNENVFSESWHIISELKVSLLSSIEIHKQYYRGESWYVLNDKFSNKFFKVSPEAYKFLTKLTIKKNVEQIWLEYLEAYPNIAPSQDEVVNLLSQLHSNSLLYFKNRADSENMFKKATEKKHKELKSKIASFLFIKIPLWNPSDWLEDKKDFINIFLSKKFLIIWLSLFIYTLVIVAENFDSLFVQGQGILSPNNLIFLYMGLVILKIFHEFGHAMMVKKFGGNVTTMGIMLIIFTPLPFMDASNSWAFKDKYQRALVGAAGMIVELLVAFICAIIWANTGEGVINSLAFNMMVVGSVSSLFFNGNPLLKFDSYYMLSDILEIPNLYQSSRDQIYFWVKKYIFKLTNINSPSYSKKESFWLASYAILSTIYKFIVAILIAVFVADQWFLMGVVVVSISLYIWVLKPIYSFINYLLYDSELRANRTNAITISSIFTIFLLILFFLIPFDDYIKAQGVVQSKKSENIYSFTEGFVKEIYISEVKYVKKGEPILKLENKELEFDIEQTNAMVLETRALKLKATENNIANLKPIEKRLSLLLEKLKFLEEKQNNLLVVATQDGLFISNNISRLKNRIIKRRELLGKITQDNEYQFIGVVTQEKSSELFNSQLSISQIKLSGVAHKTIDVNELNIIPHEQNTLPSAVLGIRGGGDIITLESDEKGLKTKESFFKVIASIKNDEKNPLLLDDRTGVLRIKIGEKTLFEKSIRFISQTLQKRYQL